MNAGFSALQRAENSSICHTPHFFHLVLLVSVLFSEPKIPQSNMCTIRNNKISSFSALQRAENSSIAAPKEASNGHHSIVSVLFSEPKIPQLCDGQAANVIFQGFSALQRAENSSIDPAAVMKSTLDARFSALQRAENSSMFLEIRNIAHATYRFSALQRAENSSIPTLAPASIHISDRDDHASSFLSLPGASP